MKNITIVGDGGWGTALALVLCRNGHRVTVWGPFEDYIKTLRDERLNQKFLPGIPLPTELSFTHDRDEAANNADAAVLVIPSKFFRPILESFNGKFKDGCLLASATKGLDRVSHHRMSETAQEVLGVPHVAALSGPSHAEEVAKGVPAAVTLACEDQDVAKELQDIFNNKTFRVYTSADVPGVEFGGALKNVIAIAAGVCDGIGFGDNSKAALITRGLAEMTRLGVAMGAQASTFSGLSGMGDLIVTCTSKLSRNRGVGERLGSGESLAEISASMEQVAEGVHNCANAKALAADAGVEVPITQEVSAIVHEGKNPRKAVEDLLARDPKGEDE